MHSLELESEGTNHSHKNPPILSQISPIYVSKTFCAKTNFNITFTLHEAHSPTSTVEYNSWAYVLRRGITITLTFIYKLFS
jgi:hypothetical protein